MVLCRLCYLEKNGESKNIFDEKPEPPIWRMVMDLTNLIIVENDPYTKIVCFDCFDELIKFHSFRNTILENDRKFKDNHQQLNFNQTCNDIDRNCPNIKMEIEDENYDLVDEKVDVKDYQINIDNEYCQSSNNYDDDQNDGDDSLLNIDDKNRIKKIDDNDDGVGDDGDDDDYGFEDQKEYESLDNDEFNTTTNPDNSNSLPKRSKIVYEKEIKHFNTWMRQFGVEDINEETILTYFRNYLSKYAASSLWTKYSMLKKTLKVYKNIDISDFHTVTSLLKNQSKSYKVKKSKVLQKEHIEKFLKNAPDSEYLMHKVVLIMGISGACRCQELVDMKITDIIDKGSYLHVLIPDARTNSPRSFSIIREVFPIDPIVLCKKYMSLRPRKLSHSRFFLNYKNNSCTTQPVGVNTVAKIPSKVAHFLKLPESELYTGHNLKRSSATLLN